MMIRSRCSPALWALTIFVSVPASPLAAKERPLPPSRPMPLRLRFREVSWPKAGNDRIGVIIEVTNPNPIPLSCIAYRPGGWKKNVLYTRKEISPLYQVEMQKKGKWEPNRVGWCGTGAGPVILPPKTTKIFTAFLRKDGWEHARVGLSWFPSDRLAETATAWSEPISAKSMQKSGK